MTKPLREEDLRDAKDFLVGSIAEQARGIGLMPKPEVHEAFVAPILRKVEVDAAEEARRASPAAATPAPPSGVKVDQEELGQVTWNLETDEVRLDAGVQAAAPPSEEEQDALAHRIYMRLLLSKPDWKARIVAIVESRDLDVAQKRVKLHDLFNESFRYFGHPRALLATAKTVMDMGRRGPVKRG